LFSVVRRLGWFVCLIALVPSPVLGSDDMKLELGVFTSNFDAGGNDDFERGGAVALQYSYAFHRWLALDAGFYISEEVQDEVRRDVVGSYQASLSTNALLLGLRPQHRFTEWQVYGRLGVLRYETELEVEEFFNEEIPGGIDSARTQGAGYYFGIGAINFITDRITIQFEYNRMTQLDLFEDRTESPFDLTINSIGIGCGFTF
jgi:opacity protein-like surface antigen